MALKLGKICQVAKFAFDRMRGVPYGGVKFQGGGVKLVRTDKLRKLNLSLEQNYGEYSKNLSKTDFDGIMRRTRPLQTGSNITTGGENLTYLNVHGGSQIYDSKTREIIMDTCERLRNPIKTFLAQG